MKLSWIRRGVLAAAIGSSALVVTPQKADALFVYSIYGAELEGMSDGQIAANVVLSILIPPYGLILEENTGEQMRRDEQIFQQIDRDLPFLQQRPQVAQTIKNWAYTAYYDAHRNVVSQQVQQTQQGVPADKQTLTLPETMQTRQTQNRTEFHVVLPANSVRGIMQGQFSKYQIELAVDVLCGKQQQQQQF